MGNDEQLKVLKKGVTAWNKWREGCDQIPHSSGPDLQEADLSGASLIGANLYGANLHNANLSDANLHRANLDDAILTNADLSGANLSYTRLVGANLRSCTLRDANLRRSDLRDAELVRAILNGADLRGAECSRANLNGAQLSVADLRGAHLSYATLLDTVLVVTNLSGASLEYAFLGGTTFYGADLSRASLMGARMANSSFWGANLKNANLCRSNLNGVDLRDADLDGTRMGQTTFADCDLSGAKGLDRVDHLEPSTIGVDTIYKSNGKISETFLRGCGVPDSLITQIHSLVGAVDGIQFYSCFISYSSKDEQFAKRLHGRMRDAHLRVWFAPEDVEAGRKLHEQIETAIRVYDKLLIVLSEASLKSQWVMDELRKGFKAERDSGKRKLFPVRLTDYETLQRWECRDSLSGKDLAEEVRQYFIPDFSNWKDHDQLEAAFSRLLKDLRAEERVK